EILRQPTDVVVRLDRRCARAAAGLDDVGVQRALYQVARPREPRRLLLEHPDELGADRLALGLRSGYAAQLAQEAVLGGDGDERDVEAIAERGDDLLALV